MVTATVSAQQLAGFTFKSLTSRYDKNRDRVITRAEAEDNPAIFEHFDLDNDGDIEEQEFNEALRELQIKQRPPHKTHRERAAPTGVTAHRNLEYAVEDGESLKLDLYLPAGTTNAPLLMWIHGGAWKNGDKSNVFQSIMDLTTQGYALASINYRLQDLTIHPKQIHDCKGALRWLRANAGEYGYDPERIAVGGGSAGGHLALLLGLSSGFQELEGTVGGNTNQSSSVSAIVDFFGPTELMVFSKNDLRLKNAHELMPELLKSASPLTYLGKDDPPVLIFHGDRDKTVPISQSALLHERYQELGLESHFHILEGKGHGGKAFNDVMRNTLIREFLDKHLGVN